MLKIDTISPSPTGKPRTVEARAVAGVVAGLHSPGVLNGVTVDELKEVLLQSAVYCGIPAANAAFRVASEVLAG
jgi:alkylhydroperoxidase/carboxymuconolactone decarboxylase family protein YurZ